MPDPSTHVRVLLLADSHLGFDLPSRPRIQRRRRGHDFLQNHRAAMAPALDGEIDLIVHGGDVFHRPHVPKSLVFQAFEPLLEAAQLGVPVFVVPGNHERSRIPHGHLAGHPRLHIFSRPGTKRVAVRGIRVALSGFPYVRKNVRGRFPGILDSLGASDPTDSIRLLAMHHCVEGATVGPVDYTFTNADDVIRCRDLPVGYAAALSGHIHRHQVISTDLRGRSLPTPVVYPGSVERTAFAEKNEAKGYSIITVQPNHDGGRVVEHEFVELPARPMLEVSLAPPGHSQPGWTPEDLQACIETTVAAAPTDAILRIRLEAEVPTELRGILAAHRLREIAPPTMNLDVIVPDERHGFRRRHRKSRSSKLVDQTSLPLDA